MKTILISGGNGKFSKALIETNTKYKILAPDKKKMNILSLKSISNFISKHNVILFMQQPFQLPWHFIKLRKKEV